MTSPGFATAENAITALFAAEWTATPLAQVQWPGQKGSEPAQDVSWVRLSILWAGAGQRVALGPRMDRYAGNIVVQCFVPLGQGNGPCTALCDAVGTVFKAGRVIQAGGRMKLLTGGMSVVGGDGRWWQHNYTCPFTRDRTS